MKFHFIVLTFLAFISNSTRVFGGSCQRRCLDGRCVECCPGAPCIFYPAPDAPSRPQQIGFQISIIGIEGQSLSPITISDLNRVVEESIQKGQIKDFKVGSAHAHSSVTLCLEAATASLKEYLDWLEQRFSLFKPIDISSISITPTYHSCLQQ